MQILKKIALCSFLLLSLSFISVGYASISRNLQISGTVNYTAPAGVYIWKAEPKNSRDATVNSYAGTNLDSTVRLSDTDGADTETITVTFYNNSQSSYLYDKITYESDAYSNAEILCDSGNPFPILDAKSFLTLDVTFSYDGGAVATDSELTSLLHFNFILAADTTVKVTEGNSSDNINSIHNGSVLFGDTSERWTNWAPNNVGRGDAVTLDIAFSEAVTFDTLDLYHFVDAEGCDFPEGVTLEYFDAEENKYMPLTFTQTPYYKDAQRTTSYGYTVYPMKIDNDKNGSFSSITIQSGYRGEMPMTSFELNSAVTTRVIRLTLDGKDADGTTYNKLGFFVGITELRLFNDGEEVDVTT